MRTKASGDRRPGLLDALIPGRFYTKRELTQQPSAQAVLARPHGWKLLWWYWLGFWLFWIVIFAACNSLFFLPFSFLMMLTPFGLYYIVVVIGLVLLFPGTYAIWHLQSRSVQAISTHILTELREPDTVFRSRKWLTYWRAVLLPGRDLGHLTHRTFGRVAGFLQVTGVLVPPLTYIAIAILGFLSDDITVPSIVRSLHRQLDDLAGLVFPTPVTVALLTLSAILFVTNMVCAHKYVTRAAYMNPEEQAGLTP